MSRIEIRRPHTLTREEAKRRADRFAAKLQEELHPEGRWYGDRYVFQVKTGLASGTGGFVDVGEREIYVLVDLPGLLSLMKTQVEAQIVDELTKLL